MFCKKCGREQKIGQKFCPICGTPFAVVVKKEHDKASESQRMPREVSEGEKPEMFMDDRNAKDVYKFEGDIENNFTPETDGNNKMNVSSQKDNTPQDTRNGINRKVKAEKTIEEKEALVKNIVLGIYAVCIFFGGIPIFFGDNAACESIDFSSSSISSGLGISTTSSKSSNSQEEEILLEMTRIREEIKSVLPKVEILYNAHQQHMAQGLPYASSPAWGKWQDCNKRIDDLWNKYIKLARKLDDNDAIIKEAQESKRTMDQTIMDMFGPHY